ncbi:GtrA family protein [Blastococcus brunescens]|uniref:GtrA family protein n=1 Tax=Blastococcus brunescens TaxID=1564165 RepID=A0ABZ1AWN0_9ACTN|nr:GtrA family protein [Blastococcus sp. BMG 8361]WRL62915.1 GtrA family protein [Blastococcus sp. BMG 8361]
MATRRTFLRFLVVNAVNTALYWGLYLLLLFVLPYLVANTVALVLAVLAAYLLNARYAFQVDASGRSLVLFLGANGTTIVLRTAVVWVLVEKLAASQELAPLLAVIVTTPVAYVLTRLAMTTRPQRTGGLTPAPVPT